jgi:PAS domain S-box-containing protein
MQTGVDELFPLIFDSITEGVFTVDGEFRVTSFNRAAERITGVERDEAIGRRCHEVFRADICQRGCALRETLESGEPKRDARVDVLNSEMEVVPIAVSTAVLEDDHGQLIGGVEIFRDITDVETLRSELLGRNTFRDIIGQSRVMKELFALIPQVAESEAPVLVSGQSGTGKEMVAQAIHDLSARGEGPFIRVNCGALPDTLLESELFGYLKGAFTGAVRNKPGRFAQADGGTLFLDEIGDISPAFQVKLLRVLEDGEFQPLGGTEVRKTDVRLVCATNRDLEQMVRDGSFREDLYYRVRVVPIEMPPLAERRKDIPLLVAHFTKLLATRSGRTPPQISRKAMRALYDYDYRGNVRELRNVIERAFVLCSGGVIDLQHLPPEVVSTRPHSSFGGEPVVLKPSERRIAEANLGESARAEVQPGARRLLAVLEANGWNRASTAAALGIGRTTLWRRMKEYGLI